MFGTPNPNGMGGPPVPPNTYHIPPHYHQQPAPRQRTAIACRYCRRRKIRCSGFETSTDGRCANCMRFNQECVFTPVSSQTGPIQAFIPAPAGAVAGRTQQIYGPHGTPLPAGYMQETQAHLPPPPYNRSGTEQQPSYMPAQDDRTHHPTLPLPATPVDSFYTRRGSGDNLQQAHPHYPNQPPSPSSHLHSPGHFPSSSMNGSSSTYAPSGYGQGPPPHMAGSYTFPPRPESPGSRSAGEAPSVSPQPPHQRFHPPMLPPHRSEMSGPSTPSLPMSIQGLIDHEPPHARQLHSARTAPDSDMLNRLNYRTGL
ncbi:putative C6 transcription factor [Sphaerosporella brunnea]|uniref:Putative C6 transcription factor n=1 Tax=Sphaerosporella brunnea TaxID=1250544 RepID=A0A5J5EDG6_9PEZI|nr:putative C6 transcription factor [Sphaerosporella brunnea]